MYCCPICPLPVIKHSTGIDLCHMLPYVVYLRICCKIEIKFSSHGDCYGLVLSLRVVVTG
jgi:hypothetical protein